MDSILSRASETDVPKDSAVHKLMPDTSYEDCFYCQADNRDFKSVDIVKLFFNSVPGWFSTLMQLREKVAGFIGLKTASLTEEQFKAQLDAYTGKKEDKLALFNTWYCDTNEIVFGEIDRHLDFCFSMKTVPEHSGTGIYLSTTVRYNNWMGPVYFFPVKI